MKRRTYIAPTTEVIKLQTEAPFAESKVLITSGEDVDLCETSQHSIWGSGKSSDGNSIWDNLDE